MPLENPDLCERMGIILLSRCQFFLRPLLATLSSIVRSRAAAGVGGATAPIGVLSVLRRPRSRAQRHRARERVTNMARARPGSGRESGIINHLRFPKRQPRRTGNVQLEPLRGSLNTMPPSLVPPSSAVPYV